MNQVLIICGPTATGKTNLGLNLAKKFNGQIISADSRQVYKDMSIGTGKDLPKGAKPQVNGSYFIKNIPIWGYDLVRPDQEFSVAHFSKFAKKTIQKIEKQNQLPIVVGGTCLYLQSITKNLETLHIKPNLKLRQILSKLSVKDLQLKLKSLNPEKLISMNHSDKNNPRRLVRAIEIASLPALTAKLLVGQSKKLLVDKNDYYWIGLTTNLKKLDQAIVSRVDARLKQGSQQEVKDLLKQGYSWNLYSMSAMGYSQWQPFFKGTCPVSSVRDAWIKAEQQYLRRQLTWFNKQTQINWFDISQDKYQDNLVNQLEAWYTKT